MLNKPGLLIGRATCAELEWRLIKEFWSGDDKIYDAYGIDRRRRIGQSRAEIYDSSLQRTASIGSNVARNRQTSESLRVPRQGHLAYLPYIDPQKKEMLELERVLI